MALQKLTVVRRPALTSIASMQEVINGMRAEIEENNYSITDTTIRWDTTSKQCQIEIEAEKRGISGTKPISLN